MSDHISRDDQNDVTSSTTSNAVGYGDHIRIAFDLGTGTDCAVAQHVSGAFNPVTNPPPIEVCLRPGQDTVLKAMAILQDDGTVIHGDWDIEQAVTNDRNAQEMVLEHYKLALDPKSKDLEEVKRVRDILQTERYPAAIQKFYTAYIRTLYNEVRQFFIKTYSKYGDAEYWNSITLVPTFSVPTMWTDKARGQLRCAAVRAGAEDVDIQDEALSVAAAYMKKLVDLGLIEQGQMLVTIDCGQGTCDIATTELVRKASSDSAMQTQRVGLTDGSEAGAGELNRLSREWVKDCDEVRSQGGLVACCEGLKLTVYDFFRRFSKEIDRIKDRTHYPQSRFLVTITGDYDSDMPSITIMISREKLMEWYEKWLTKLIKLLRTNLRSKPLDRIAYVVLAGGPSGNPILRGRVEAFLAARPYEIRLHSQLKCDYPVAHGALLYASRDDELPNTLHFFLSRHELYYPELHGWKANTHPAKFDKGAKEVHGCLASLMKYSSGQFREAKTVPMWFLVDPDQRCLTVELYHSEKPRDKHRPVFDKRRRLVNGIREYPIMFMDLPDLSQAGYRTLPGEDFLRVNAFVDLYADVKKGLRLRVTLMKPSYNFLNFDNDTALDRTSPANPEALPYDDHDVLGNPFEESIWSPRSSHFISTSTGTAGSRSSKTRTRDESEMDRSRSPTICFDGAPSASRGTRERPQDCRSSHTRYSHRLRDRLDVDVGDDAAREPDGQPPRKKQATAMETRERLGVFQESPSARRFKRSLLTALSSNAMNAVSAGEALPARRKRTTAPSQASLQSFE